MQGSDARVKPLQQLDSKRPTATSTIVAMSARSDDSAVAAAAALAQAVASGGSLPASATVEAMEAGAALSPPPSPRVSIDIGGGAAFAFDTARLSRSPPLSSPPLAGSGRAQATVGRPPRAAAEEATFLSLHREPSLSPEPTAIINGSSAAATAAATATSAAAALAAAEHESAASDFVRTRRAIQLRLVLEIERKLRMVRSVFGTEIIYFPFSTLSSLTSLIETPKTISISLLHKGRRVRRAEGRPRCHLRRDLLRRHGRGRPGLGGEAGHPLARQQRGQRFRRVFSFSFLRLSLLQAHLQQQQQQSERSLLRGAGPFPRR